MGGGFAVADFANNKRNHNHVRSEEEKALKRRLVLLSDVGASLCDRSRSDEPRTNTTSSNISALLPSSLFKDEARKLIKPVAQQWNHTKTLNTADLLLLLKEVLRIE